MTALPGTPAIQNAIPVPHFGTTLFAATLVLILINRSRLTAGSASATLTVTLDAFGETFAQMATVAGIEPALMHRIVSQACGLLSMLPNSGAIVTRLAIFGATQKQSYAHIGVVTVIGPLLVLMTAIVLGTLFGAF